MPILYNLITAHNGKPRYSRLEFCHTCGSRDIILNKTPEGRNSVRNKHGQWECIECGASVGAHSDGNPQGYMADPRIRKLRYDFHRVMTVLLDQQYSYDDICSYLQARINIDADHFHSAWLTAGELIVAINAMEERAKRPFKNRPFKTEIRRRRNYMSNASAQKKLRLNK